MAKSTDLSIKDGNMYETLREKGYGKSKAARIANAQANDDMALSRKGGKASAYEQWDKGALYERAQELDISGRSDMTKDELISALRDN